MMIGNQSSVFNTGVNGMLRSYSNIATDANTIARAGTTETSGDYLPDLTMAMVDMKMNQHVFDASAKVVKTTDEMMGTLLDIQS